MKTRDQNCGIIYRPILFLIGTFIISWNSIYFMTKLEAPSQIVLVLFNLLDFLENASPLLCACLLLKEYLFKDKFLWKFLFGKFDTFKSYILVFLLFAAQFLSFYWFQIGNPKYSIQTFLITFVGQFLLGGGLEEAGWRGYLLPCFYQKCNLHIILSSIGVSMIWVVWHLPYFFMPNGIQANTNFLFYAFVGIITGLILTAIYSLTNSILLCMLFHSWQNTIVLTIQIDLSNPRFLLMFLALGIISALLCLNQQRKSIIQSLKS